jgi:Beta-lactamase enzyme family
MAAVRALVIALAASACAVGAAPAAAAPPTARQQLRWLVDVSGRLPASPAEVAQHIDSGTLTAIGGPARLNSTLAAIGPLRVRRQFERRPRLVRALVSGPKARFAVEVQTNAAGLITLLSFTPYLAAPTSWRSLDARLHALAPRVGFAAATITRGGRCRVLHGDDPGRARPLASMFKLYVLGALGHAVLDQRARWDERLAIRDAWKSIPSGTLQNAPAGTALPLRTYADLMISISDNTAADHLIHRLGRAAVQRQLRRFGNRHARRDIPFLTTRELSVLKGVDFPALAERYLALSRPARARALAALDRIPLSAIAPWTAPRYVDRLEWLPHLTTSVAPMRASLARTRVPGWRRSAARCRSTTAGSASTAPATRPCGSRADPSPVSSRSATWSRPRRSARSSTR